MANSATNSRGVAFMKLPPGRTDLSSRPIHFTIRTRAPRRYRPSPVGVSRFRTLRGTLLLCFQAIDDGLILAPRQRDATGSGRAGVLRYSRRRDGWRSAHAAARVTGVDAVLDRTRLRGIDLGKHY